MTSISSQKLLLIAPHFKTFIKDQAVALAPHFREIAVLLPTPAFSSLALRLPFVHKYFTFVKPMLDSRNAVVQNFEILSPHFFTLPLSVLRDRNCFLTARSCIKSLSRNSDAFDLIHAHFLENGFAGAALKHLYDKPFVLTAHGGDVYDLPFRNDWYNNLARYILTEANQVITVSQFNAEKLLSLGISSNKLHVIPNGYDANLFKRISSRVMRQELGLPLGKRILLSVGNLVGEKGHTCLIAAMNTVLKRRSDVILVIVGSGPLKERLEKKITQLGLNGKVLLVGRKAHEEIPMWMNASDIFVLPSINEGFPTVVPEAMACGKPVIGTKVGGIPEAITNDDLGILVNPKDPEILESAILKALEKKWKPETILEHAKTYSWSNLATQILTVYQKALLNWES
jgi:glycosyltransferase involved in cell wall biosynthesis